MKRRFRGAAESDSLELLLDTLCNVFGGIVLIACLLAILPRQQMPPPLLPTDHASSEMIERRVLAANEEISRLRSAIERYSKTTDPVIAVLQARRDSLRRLQQRLESEVKVRDETELDEAEARALVAKVNPEILEEELVQAKMRQSKIEGLHSSVIEKIRFLEQRGRSLDEEVAKLAKGRIQAVRFPRERNSKASPFPIIIRYNAVYPMHLGANLDRNPAVERIPIRGDDAVRAKPVPGKGITVPMDSPRLLDSLKAAARKKHYATLYLYPDSHEVFLDLREALADSGLNYGLEFIHRGAELTFSSKGSAPPEL